ncbi:hypothetical protein SAMN04487941_0264 [Pontibacter akesuensis]|uniref:Uncharacterized protein n=1 Tax=Pontibacter akesuensis TaxID=388950 RepID=A0A1I7FK15_9BACT|nr:hypothetical protein SAMN04487941_0264 [Pontibacter akesuensis]
MHYKSKNFLLHLVMIAGIPAPDFMPTLAGLFGFTGKNTSQEVPVNRDS